MSALEVPAAFARYPGVVPGEKVPPWEPLDQGSLGQGAELYHGGLVLCQGMVEAVEDGEA
eukprot:7705683-Pyramimonas_sp.AAC.1